MAETFEEIRAECSKLREVINKEVAEHQPVSIHSQYDELIKQGHTDPAIRSAMCDLIAFKCVRVQNGNEFVLPSDR